MPTVVIGEQSSKGTYASSLTEIPNVTSASLRPDVNIIDEATIHNRLARVVHSAGVKASGRVELFASTKALKLLLSATFLKAPTSEQVDTDGDSTNDATKYTFTPWEVGDTLVYHTIEQIYGSEALKIKDAAVNRLEVRIEANEIPRMTAEFVGCMPEKTSPDSYVASTADVYGFHEATVEVGGSTLTATGATLTIENGIADDYFKLGDKYLADILPGEFTATVELTLKPTDLTLLLDYLESTSKSVTVTLQKATNEKLVVTGTAIVTEFESPIENPAANETTVTLKFTDITVELYEPL